MMQKFITPFLACILIISSYVSKSQDVHFSQYDAAPLYFNPAQTGLFDCNRRVIANVKGQWSTYNTIMLSYDQPYKKLSFMGGDFGIGGLVYSDHGGETSYGNTQFKFMPAYHKSILGNKVKLSTGLDILFNITSIDESKVVLPGNIDPNTGGSSQGVTFDNPSYNYADLGIGFNLQYNLRVDIPLNTGITLYRLFRSGGGGIEETGLNPYNYQRYSLNSNAVIPINGMISAMPSFIFLKQKKYNEMNLGSFVKFDVGSITPVVDAFYGGAWYRFGDAVVLGFAFDKPISQKWVMNFGFSYDVTVSAFRVSDKWQNTGNVGTDSFEFSIKFMQCKAPIVLTPPGIINDPFR